ncbi:MAG: gephyrin-like molybdotransferase Glp [Myxococcota bacterium]
MREGLSVEEAQASILRVTSKLGSEMVATEGANARVLAESIEASRCQPPSDCSAMDGYAVRHEDLRDASPENPISLPVVFEVAAGGQPERPLAPGEAARIFTGAPLPAGADTVVKQEDTRPASGGVEIWVSPVLREHVRDAGEDFDFGDRLIESGTVLGPPHFGVLASIGRSVVSVHQRPTVAILSGGNELVEPDRPAAAGQIVSSNSYTLAAQCREVGARPSYLGIASDRPAEIEARLRDGLRADVIVSSAGVSVGDHDHVRSVLEKLGCKLDFWGVRMKPGFPMVFGVIESSGTLVFGLPGNPVSAYVTFEQFVRPALRKMLGHRALFRPVVRAELTQELKKRAGRLHFVRVTLERRGGILYATPTANQGSGVLTSLIRGDGLAIFKEHEQRLEIGSEVDVQLIEPGFFDQIERGF